MTTTNEPSTEVRAESCQDCGVEQPCIWTAPDDLWAEVTGITNGSGIFCPSCFEKRADVVGVGLIRWVPERIDAWRTKFSRAEKTFDDCDDPLTCCVHVAEYKRVLAAEEALATLPEIPPFTYPEARALEARNFERINDPRDDSRPNDNDA